MDEASLYDTDIVAWAEEQSRAVRELATRPGLSNALDWENIAEEIESLGRSYVGRVERFFTLAFIHLLKIVSAPDLPAMRGWRAEVLAFQQSARRQYSRSMARLIDMDELWRDARKGAKLALDEWGDRLALGVPERCPFTLDELLARDFDVDEALEKLGRAIGQSDRPV